MRLPVAGCQDEVLISCDFVSFLFLSYFSFLRLKTNDLSTMLHRNTECKLSVVTQIVLIKEWEMYSGEPSNLKGLGDSIKEYFLICSK